jgi:hypothetical protein
LASETDLPEEKWLVGFRRHSVEVAPTTENIFIRQFYASGFYEAYDIVMGHAERHELDVIWFREKRECEAMTNKDFPVLEALCTYCNKTFNCEEPIPCQVESCSAEFCSKVCFDGHRKLKHVHRDG